MIDTRYYMAFFQFIGLPISILLAFKFFTIPWLLLSLAVFIIVKLYGGTIMYHRILSHNMGTIKFEWLRKTLLVLGLYSTYTTPMGFASIHNNHHKYMDTEKDPHCPKTQGWKSIVPLFWRNVYTPHRPSIARLSKDSFSVSLTKNFHYIALAPLALLVFPKLFLFGFLLPVSLSIWSFLLVVYGHDYKGVVNRGKIFDILSMGEGLHRNHHIDPSRLDWDSPIVKYTIRHVAYV